MSSDLKSEVRKALEEIKYDDWHKSVHREIMYEAQKRARPSDKEQSVVVMCGVCNEILKFRLPRTSLPLKATNKVDGGAE